ncbi:MAG: glycosyltransferase [Deltaproteobacteria bacterium]|nr:glycosyltransferase [Deltaproteobacteria bacterium]
MKILHVIPAVAAQYGGPSQAIFEMCRALQDQAVKPLIVTTDADGMARLPVPLERITTYKGVESIFFPRQWSEKFKYSRPLARWLDQNVPGFDAVHIHSVFSYPCLTAAWACRHRGVPYIVRPLGTLDPWSLRQKRMRKKILWHVAARRMLRGAQAVHYTTREEQRLAEGALGLDHGVVIPLGVDWESLRAPAQEAASSGLRPFLENEPYVLTLCRLHPKKGLDLLLEAFLALTKRREFERWRLVVAGDGEPQYVATLRRIVRESGAADRILFAGWLEGPDKFSALKGAAILALPSYQENFGLSVMEALGCGVPVLVSPYVNLAGEIQAAGAGWVVSLEPVALEKTMAEVLLNGGERTRRGEAARKLAERFRWPEIAAQMIQLYKFLAKARSAPPGFYHGADGNGLGQQKNVMLRGPSLSVNHVPLSVVILTYNEEINLPACLGSLKGLACEVFVVDSGSTDRTVEIAMAAGAIVVDHPFDNYAAQRNWAQGHLQIHTDWVLHLDADERLTPELVKEINQVLQKPPPNVDGFLLSKRTVFMGRWIKHGGHYPSYHLRLFRKERGFCEDRLYDQHFVVDGRVRKLRHDYLDVITSDLPTWTQRHTRWAELEAWQIVGDRKGGRQVRPTILGNPIERRRWLREYLYVSLPLFVRAFLYWFYRYFIRLGFLDGKEGFIFHFLQAFWFRTLVDIKLDELRRRPEKQRMQQPGAG